MIPPSPKYILYIITLLFSCAPTSAYVIQQYHNESREVISLHWPLDKASQGIPVSLNRTSFPHPQTDVQRVFQNAIAPWNAVETANVVLRETLLTTTQVADDGHNVISYDTTGNDLKVPASVGVIALTRLHWESDGTIRDADMVFNGRDFDFTADGTQTSPTRLDLQDVMTHEFGHLLGLDHSALRGVPVLRPTMTPFYMILNPFDRRTLQSDDIAGLTDLYPSATQQTGTITGYVQDSLGQGVFGTHVVAYKANTQTFVASAFSGTSGSHPSQGLYRIAGLPPGTYQIAIEPLNGWVSHHHFSGIFNTPFPSAPQREYFPNHEQQAPAFQLNAGQTLSHINFAKGIGKPDTNVAITMQPFSTIADPIGPYRFAAQIQSRRSIANALLLYQINGGPYHIRPLQRNRDYEAELPDQPLNTQIDYRILVQTTSATETVYPPWDQPPLQFQVTETPSERLFVALNRSGEIAMLSAVSDNIYTRLNISVGPTSIAFSPKRNRLFVTHTVQTGVGFTSIIDVATQTLLSQLDIGSTPLDLVISPDENRVYVTKATGRSISVIDTETMQQLWQLPVRTAGEGPFGIAISSDGTTLYLTDPAGSQVIIIDADRGTEHHRISTVTLPRSLALSQNLLYVTGFEGGISVIDVQTAAVLRTINTAPASSLYRIVITPDGQRAFLTDPFNNNLLVLNLNTESITHILPCGQNPREIALSPDGQTIYVANQDANTITRYNAQTFESYDPLPVSDGPRGIIVWDPASHNQTANRADIDGNGTVEFADFLIFVRAFDTSASDSQFDIRLDFNSDGQIDFADFLIFAQAFGN